MPTPHSPALAPTLRRNRAFLYGGVAAIIVAVVLVSLAALMLLREQAENRAALTTQYLARSVAQTFEGMIESIDIALLTCADEIARQTASGKVDKASINLFLARQAGRDAEIDYLRATNERGDIIFGAGALSAPASVADRDYFTRMRDNPGEGLLISRPFVARISQTMVWTFARRVNKPDGSFGGLVYAAIRIDHVEKMLAQVRMDRGGSIALRDADAGLIARHTFESANPIPVGDKRLAVPFEQALAANLVEGTYTSDATGVDNLSRVYSYVRNSKHGYLVNVGISTEAAFAAWRRQAWVVAWLVAAFALALLAYARLIGQAWRRQQSDMAALEASERRAKAISEASPVPHAMNDEQGNITYLNAAYVRLFGYTRDDMRTLEDWWPKAYPEPAYRQWVTETWQKRVESAFRNNTPFEPMEVDIRCKDGTVKTVLVGAADVSLASPGMHLVTFYDVTERRRTEEALRDSEGRLSIVFQSSPIAIVVSTVADGRVLECNDAALRLYGYTREEGIGRTTAELGTYVNPAQRDALVKALYEHGGVDRFPVDFRRSDGAVGVIELSGRIVELKGEACLVSMLVDVTERKRLEEVHLRAQKLESLGTLTGGIAHDFNNILAAILGNAELAAEDVGPDHIAAQSLKEIRKASVRASELVRRIMAFGRPKEVSHEAIDLGAVVGEVLDLVRSTLPAGIAIIRDVANNTPPVLADAGQVHEVVMNLTTNAAYAIGPRAGSIEYRIVPVEVNEQFARGIPGLEPGRYARLTVSDSGCGMDAATLERVFDAFYTTKPVGEGTGLGLSMVHGIMRSHGGAVTVESAPGKGATFSLYFRAATGAARKDDQSAPAQRQAAPGRRVLFVDDEEALALLAERVLTRLGHRVFAFSDPLEALRAFRARPQDFDVLVTDLSMPHMSGLELAREVLALRPGMPVLLTTGYLRAEDEHEARAAGIRQLVLKPNTMDDLGHMLDRLFRDAGPNGAQTS